MLKTLAPLFLSLLFISNVQAATPYRLGIVLVVDQFRADYLMRFKDEFVKAGGATGGFRFLMDQGAYFPLADHELFQNMTGPGHAGILSGSYPYRNGISINAWFNREKGRPEYCVEDESVKLIGSDGALADKMGMSPKNFNATTLGDELKNVDRPSRVVSVAIKDRAAVLLGGKRADIAVWLEDKSCQWVSSSFYVKELPEFVKGENKKLKELSDKTMDWGPYHSAKYCSTESLQTPWGIQKTFDLALAAVDGWKLGRGNDVDLLAVSLSSHDYLGHRFGPNDSNLKEMTLQEDKKIAAFLQEIAKRVPGGMKNVFVVLTGDHGIPPSPKNLPKEKIPGENVDLKLITQSIESAMTDKFGKPHSGKWVESIVELQVYFNADSMTSAKISPADAVTAIRPKMLKEKYIDQIWARDEIMFQRKVPAGEYGRVLDRTLSLRSGDMLLVLNPFFYSDTYPMTHMTHYSYDRFVPLILWGKTFKPGTYRQIVRIVDIAPTLSSILEVIPPAQSEGRILTEALR